MSKKDTNLLCDVPMSDPTFDEIMNLVMKSFPNACVLFMERVLNFDLIASFERRKEEMIEKRGAGNVREELMFHGTRSENIMPIVKDGFLPEKNKVSAFGMGTYFASAASYSKNYAPPARDEVAYMFVCRVLIGKMLRGIGNAVLDTDKYDNFVDNPANPSIVVTPHADGAIPAYIVAFHPYAR
jgi:hypothetical protein